MSRFAVILVMVCAACDARINGSGGNGDDTSADAPRGSDATVDDDASTVGTDAPPAPACANGRKVYLNFTGVTLNDAITSDAIQNRASWMTNGVTVGTAPPYKQNDANRLTLIQNLVDGVKAQLAPYPIEVVVTRPPPTAPYMMIVFGGTQTQVGSRFGGGVQELDCGDLVKSDVAWLGDNIDPQRAINTVMGAIGFGLGLTATNDQLGCMCGWDNDCQRNNTVNCRLATTIARDPAARQLCPGVTTQNEVAAFSTQFCQ